ncbi:MAG: sigma-70 family RNA polymerase sigma factor [Planctomycetota bacterium]
MSDSPTVQDLLEQEDFLRALVRGLLADEHEVDDVIQQTWLQALTKPPRSLERLRGWLAIVARNLARRQRRGESRRSRREESASLEERIPPTDRIVERLELQRVLVGAVLGLGEPYRTTVMLRFFDEKSVSDIAREMNVPPATVHTRLRRGLEMLRARLDDERDGRHSAWRLALLPLLPERSTLATGASIGASLAVSGWWFMTSSKSVAAVVAVALGALLWWGWPESGADTPGELVADRPVSVLEPLESSPKNVESLPVETPPTDDEADEAAPASSSDPSTGDLLVRTLWEEERTPAKGVWIEVGSGTAPFHSARSYLTGEDGEVRISGLVPTQWSVRPLRGGAVRKATVERGRDTKLQILIPRGIDVTGVVVDERGQPVVGAEIRLHIANEPETSVPVGRSQADGRFEVSNVLGRSIQAWAKGYRVSYSHHIDGSPGTKRRLRLVLPGPAGTLAGRLSSQQGEPVAGAVVMASERRVRSAADGEFELPGLEPKTALPIDVITDEGHWQFKADVAAGMTTHVEWRLDPAATAKLEGRLAWEGGEPLADALVRIGGNWDRIGSSTRTGADGRFVMEGLLPGKVSISTMGFFWLSEQIELKAGETAHWEPQLPVLRKQGVIEGQIVDSDGLGLGGWYVTIDRDGNRFIVQTDDQGRFQQTMSPEYEYQVFANPPSIDIDPPVVIRRGVRVQDGFLRLEVPAAMMPSSYLTGQLRSEDPWLLESTDVWVAVDGSGYRQQQYGTIEDGAFRVGPLPPGSYRLACRSTGASDQEVGRFVLAANETVDVGEVLLERAGRIFGRLRAEDGSAVEIKKVRATQVDDWRSWTTDAAIEGDRFSVSNIEAGHWRLEASLEGYPDYRIGEYDLVSGQELDLGVVPVPLPGRIELNVTRGSSVDSTARLHVFGEGDFEISSPLDRSILSLWPGTYRVVIHGELMADQEHSVDVLAGETTRLSVDCEEAVGCLLAITKASEGFQRGNVVVKEKGGDRVLMDETFDIVGNRVPKFFGDLPAGAWEIRWTTGEGVGDVNSVSTVGRGIQRGVGNILIRITDSDGRLVRSERLADIGEYAPTTFARLRPGRYRVEVTWGEDTVAQWIDVPVGVSRWKLFEIRMQ